MDREQELTAFSKFGWKVDFAIDNYRERSLFLSSGARRNIGILIFWNILLNALSNFRGFKGSSVFWLGLRLLLGPGEVGGRT